LLTSGFIDNRGLDRNGTPLDFELQRRRTGRDAAAELRRVFRASLGTSDQNILNAVDTLANSHGTVGRVFIPTERNMPSGEFICHIDSNKHRFPTQSGPALQRDGM
jgi:hypothetical protein